MGKLQPGRHCFPDLEGASSALADLVVETARAAVADKGFCSLVLAGGSTPRRLYELLAAPPRCSRLPWERIFVFWGDERCVSADDERSNFRLASELLQGGELPADNILAMVCGDGDPDDAAARYEAQIGAFFVKRGLSLVPGRHWPSFDLVLLGMGKDGHTASLFPGDPLLAEKKRWVAPVPLPPVAPQVARLTLTLPVLNRAGRVAFLMAGPAKRRLLDEFARDPVAAGQRYPAAMVRPAGDLYWFVACD